MGVCRSETPSQSKEFLGNTCKDVTENQEPPDTKARAVWPVRTYVGMWLRVRSPWVPKLVQWDQWKPSNYLHCGNDSVSSGCQRPQYFLVVVFPSSLGTLWSLSLKLLTDTVPKMCPLSLRCTESTLLSGHRLQTASFNKGWLLLLFIF